MRVKGEVGKWWVYIEGEQERKEERKRKKGVVFLFFFSKECVNKL